MGGSENVQKPAYVIFEWSLRSPFLIKRYWVLAVPIEATLDKKAFDLILVTSLVLDRGTV